MYSAAWLTQAIAKATRLKKMTADNIKLVLPESDAPQLAEKLISNVSYSIYEVLCQPFFRKQHFQSILRWEGLENLENALKDKKGAIMLTMHAGNYELLSVGLANLGYKMNAVLRASENDPIFQIVNQCRSHSGVNLINVIDKDMFKEAVKILGRNELIGLLADTGALESRHMFYNFLGKEVPVATGWLTLAQRANCAIIPILARREGRINIATLYEPLKITKSTREDVMQKSLKIFEDFIKQNPDHWAFFLNSYETRRMVDAKTPNEQKR
jgi:lauroyl/myristoyl acyltransferase